MSALLTLRAESDAEGVTVTFYGSNGERAVAARKARIVAGGRKLLFAYAAVTGENPEGVRVGGDPVPAGPVATYRYIFRGQPWGNGSGVLDVPVDVGPHHRGAT